MNKLSQNLERRCDTIQLKRKLRRFKLLDYESIVVLLHLLQVLLLSSEANSLKSKFGTFTVISAKPCQNALGQSGTCMFMWDCIKSEGLHLGTCSDRFLFGSCCYHNSTFNDVDIQRPSSNVSLPAQDSKSQELVSNVVMYSVPTTQQPLTTSFLQSGLSSSGHLNSLISNKPPVSLNGEAANVSSAIESWTEYPQNTSNTTSKTPSSQGQDTVIVITQTPTTQSPNPTTITSQSTTTTNPNLNSHFQLQQSEPQVLTQLAPNKPTPRPMVSVGQSPDQPVTTMSQTVRPQGSWLSRPASILANAIFHSFKPFPYLSPNRQRPTYRPYVGAGYRPPHYRPTMAYQRPGVVINSGAQINQQNQEIASSSSETSFSNSTNLNNATQRIPIATTPLMQQNSDFTDHHIVNPTSFVSMTTPPPVMSIMTDRQRPMDKSPFQQQYGEGLDLNQKHNHYDILNVTASGSMNMSSSSSSSSGTHQNEASNHTYPTQSEAQTAVYELNLDHNSSHSDSLNHTSNFASVLIRPTNTYHNVDNHNDLSFGHQKPVVSLIAGHNGSVNYPSYPLISSFSSGSTSALSTVNVLGNQFSSLSPIDEIHGLSERPLNHTSALVAQTIQHPQVQSMNVYNNQANQSLTIDQSGSSNGIESSQELPGKPSENQMVLADKNVVPTTTSSPTIIIGNLDAPAQTATSIGYPTYPQSNLATPTTTASSSVIREPATISSLSTRQPVTTMTTTPQDGGSSKRPVTNKEATCGVTAAYPQTKVVGGKNAAFGAWPWQVSVRKVSFFGFSSTHRCGGAVISSEWIATAGHCVEDLALQSIRIRVGEYDFSSMAEPFPYIERAARRKVVHPKYNFYTYENDLALVQLDQPIVFPPHISPICLPPDNIDLLGRNATVTGWGRLNEGGTLPTILQEVRVPIVSNDKCKDMFLNAGRPEYIPDIFLCAGYEEGGRDSCQGDSGGPLQVKGDDGKWFLAGIISWGIGCAEQNLPGVCTRISRFKLWIQSTMSSSA